MSEPDGFSADAIADTTLSLLAFDTTNPPGTTREIATWIERWLDDRDITSERVGVDPAKPNVLARIPGRRSASLIFCGHLDTVPVDPSGWTYDPAGERVGNRIYGRGAVDMKGAIAAMLHVADRFANSESPPPITLEFAFVSDEEVAGDAGITALIEMDRLSADGCVIGEPTCTETAHSVTVADRGSIWVTLDAVGESAHGSRPMLGVNAIDRLWDAITRIRGELADRTVTVPDELEPILEDSIRFFTPSMGAEQAASLFRSPTVNLGTIGGGESVNSVPRSATAELDIRVTAGVDTAPLLGELRACIEACPGVSISDVSRSVGTYELVESPLVRSTVAAAEDVLEQSVLRRSATGGGDAKQLRHHGVPTVEFALGTDTVHACDEYTTTGALVDTARVYAQLPGLFFTNQDRAYSGGVQTTSRGRLL